MINLKNLKLVVASLLLVTTQVFAAPLNVIAPTGVASATDVSARAILPYLDKELNTTSVVFNKPGANSVIGINYFLDQDPNNSILVTGAAGTVKQFAEVLEPIAGLSTSPMYIVSSNSKTLKELVKRKNLFAGGNGVYSVKSSQYFDKLFGTVTTMVNYNERMPQMIDLSNGLTDYSVVTSANTAFISLQKAGKINVLATIEDERSYLFPDVLTLKEQGYASIEGFAWVGVFVNQSASQEFKDKIKVAIKNIVSNPEFKKTLSVTNQVVLPLEGKKFKSLVEKNRELLKD